GIRVAGYLVLIGLVVLIASDTGPARTRAEQRPPEAGEPMAAAADDAPPVTNIVRQGFPAGSADPNNLTKSETAWEIGWELTHPTNKPFSPPGSVLRIKSAKFMWKDKSGKPQWVVVARMLELSEIYVPYDNGTTAFLDIHDMPFYITPARKEFPGPACVPPGEALP